MNGCRQKAKIFAAEVRPLSTIFLDFKPEEQNSAELANFSKKINQNENFVLCSL